MFLEYILTIILSQRHSIKEVRLTGFSGNILAPQAEPFSNENDRLAMPSQVLFLLISEYKEFTHRSTAKRSNPEPFLDFKGLMLLKRDTERRVLREKGE